MKLDKKTVKELELNSLLTIFFNLNKVTNKIYSVNSTFRQSKHSNDNICSFINTIEKSIVYWTKLEFKSISDSTNYIYEFDSDLKLDELLDLIYSEIQLKKIKISQEEFERKIIISLFAFRGSADFKLNFYSVDVPKILNNEKYFNLLFLLLTNISQLNLLNLNFRELQNDYIEKNKKRNTQIRINLKWFFDNFSENLRMINIYKYNILIKNKNLIKDKNIDNFLSFGFIERLLIYKDKILPDKHSENLNESNIKIYREALKFDEEDKDGIVKRNTNLIKVVRETLPDICYACNDLYPIENRTFKFRNKDMWYLEIHHVISFSKDSSSDQIDNLVKLCPSCHKALTKNRAEQEYQLKLINNIVRNANFIKEYVSILAKTNNVDKIVEFIYKSLA
ncbi:HNH endonuclease [Mycoplasmopsis anatis]|uniref:HNH domain-containing protein n=1 Tax=Mycoplasmopsis anatis 1340 TaxID=1034808 RepID=F9QCK9_9BACT|nr:HNH endonuclease signature motif containing protein [Mycoplasmopsis anatis]AWX70410.1 HNH endonuclease [Mycoplasmopsis anatis]EGS29505.1 hypothetical protein GIG_00827 [Mycoplasmopsis anatis 1340]VEU73935.1 HNH endonuclease [Mycoplasmopsis anatis]